MLVTIKYLNILRWVRGVEEEALEIEEGSTGEDLIQTISKRDKALSSLLLHGEEVNPSLYLYQGEELLPLANPLSGEEVILVIALPGG